MKNKPSKPTHTMVLSIAIVLTVFSIIGSVAAAGLIPLADNIDSLVNKENTQSDQVNNAPKNDQQTTTTHQADFKKIEFRDQPFQSAIKPKLWSCFNCGVVTAIESMSEDTEDLAAIANEDGLLNYLEAHRENARIIALDDTENNTDRPDQSENQHMTYLIKVRMQDGTQHVIKQDTPPEHEVGDKVRLTIGKVITA